MKHRKVISKILSLLLAVTLVITGLSLTSITTWAANNTVTINNQMDVSKIMDTIQLLINDAGSDGIITVTGSKDNVNSTLNLEIEAGVTVIWEANYSGTANQMINLKGNGILNVAAGGTVSTTNGMAIFSNEGANVTVSGGIVSATGNAGEAINTQSGKVIVSGGEVSANGDSGVAIRNPNGDVMVSGSGMVEGTGNYGRGIYSYNNGSVLISGGTVRVTSGWAVNTGEGNVMMTGGAVSATTGIAIQADTGDIMVCNGSVKVSSGWAITTDSGNVTVSGGTVSATNGTAITIDDNGVSAYLKGTCSGEFYIDSDICMIVEVDTLLIPKLRNGTSTGLTNLVGGGIAKWDTSGTKPRIVFTLTNGSTKSLEWGTYVTATVPSAPQSFTATAGDGKVTLNWKAPTSDGGAAIMKYEVSCDNGGTWIAATSNTSHTFIGLTNGIAYTFKVRAVNSEGKGTVTSATAKPQTTPTPMPTPTIIKVTGVKTLSSIYLAKGKTATLPAAVQPNNAANKNVTWSSNRSSTVKVQNSKTGAIRALKAGSAELTVKTADGSRTAKCKVTVTSKATKLKSLAITPNKATGLLVGRTLQVKPKFSPTKATGIVPKYKSSNTTVAVIDKTGVITALKTGKTTITVTAGSKKKTFTLTVGKVAATRITLNKKAATVRIGNTTALKVKAFVPSNSNPKTMTWTSSSKKIATVSSKGIVKGIKKGTATITATTWNKKTAKCTVTVK